MQTSNTIVCVILHLIIKYQWIFSARPRHFPVSGWLAPTNCLQSQRRRSLLRKGPRGEVYSCRPFGFEVLIRVFISTASLRHLPGDIIQPICRLQSCLSLAMLPCLELNERNKQ